MALSRLRQAAKKNPPEAEKVFALPFLSKEYKVNMQQLRCDCNSHDPCNPQTATSFNFSSFVIGQLITSQGNNGVGSNLIPLIGSPGARARVVSGGNRR